MARPGIQLAVACIKGCCKPIAPRSPSGGVRATQSRACKLGRVLRADRYIGSFPKVGIVIPNPVVWLLPEFQDLAASVTTTLSLPNLLPHGAFVTPTSDGFLLSLPTSAPRLAPCSQALQAALSASNTCCFKPLTPDCWSTELLRVCCACSPTKPATKPWRPVWHSDRAGLRL